MAVRSLVHRLGYRFRLHRRSLPGCPDLVFVARKKVIFVHGCFWHGHAGCKDGRLPKSNLDYWTNKIGRNQRRDSRAVRRLRADGWGVMTIWECQTSNLDAMAARLRRFLA
ncbi:MAG: DNA mismatch endonuclease Vsr [Polaromonas sp.]|nr:DNA mismatch endonuclease Vsr [Polaromonas sp.]